MWWKRSTVIAVANDGHMEMTEPRTNRRQHERVFTLFKTVIIDHGKTQAFAIVKNISDRGVCIQYQKPIALGDMMTLQFSDKFKVSGKTVWTNGDQYGIQLNDTIDSDKLLRELADHGDRYRRSLRLPFSGPAVSKSSLGTKSVQICDISSNGVKLKHDGSFEEGLAVKVLLGQGIERRGVVRWSKDGIAGIMLLEPLSPHEMNAATNNNDR